MIINLTDDQCSRLSMACLTLAHSFQRDANNTEFETDRRESARCTANMWMLIHDEIRAQIDAQRKENE